jgi:hypothetical protein
MIDDPTIRLAYDLGFQSGVRITLSVIAPLFTGWMMFLVFTGRIVHKGKNDGTKKN